MPQTISADLKCISPSRLLQTIDWVKGEGKNKAPCGEYEKSWKNGKASRPSCQRYSYSRVCPGSAYGKETPSRCQRKRISHVDDDNDGGDDDSDGVADAVSVSGLRSKAAKADSTLRPTKLGPFAVISR